MLSVPIHLQQYDLSPLYTWKPGKTMVQYHLQLRQGRTLGLLQIQRLVELHMFQVF